MQQSYPVTRFRRVSQPSIHLPCSSYLPGTKIAGSGFNMRSFAPKNSSLADNASAPKRRSARLRYRRVKSGASSDEGVINLSCSFRQYCRPIGAKLTLIGHGGIAEIYL